MSVVKSLIRGVPGDKVFLTGNEAIARGAIEAGVQVATAYPGTPSTEILETLAEGANHHGIYVEWSTNEKVAFEVVLAASYCGLRAMASMKHVGVNVAHDPLMTSAHIGARGGLVLVSADDPYAWSSQNEQDSRFTARQAYFPVFEPRNPQEAKDMTAKCFEFSEQYHHPIMLRPTTRVCHAKADVVLGEVPEQKRRAMYERNTNLMLYDPIGARINKIRMINRFDKIRETVNEHQYNQLQMSDGAVLGIIGCGISYNYVREAIRWLGLDGKVSLLKVGITHPVPEKLIQKLLKSVDEALVVEELEPFVELYVRAISKDVNPSVKVHGKNFIPLIGELSTRKVIEALVKITGSNSPIDYKSLDKFQDGCTSLLPKRPPSLCPGCPHRVSLYAIKVAAKKVAAEEYIKAKPIFSGDIGCYTLGYLPPIEALDSVVCMGGSIGLANGYAHIVEAPIIAVIGDSTFLHSGIPALINAVCNKANIMVAVLDNDTTAMTGFQPHPGSGVTATGLETTRVKIEDVARGCGVKFVEIVDPYDIRMAQQVVRRALKHKEPSVVVFRRRCRILELREKGEKIIPLFIDPEKCINCGICINSFGCPAIVKREESIFIDSLLCNGCGICAEICPHKAIVRQKQR